jgi:AraC family transcriptional regulator of adaptative response / DNA-3-methyladenine glycosylase II
VWDGFEAAVLAVLGQKLTKPGSMRTVSRLVTMFGAQVDTPIRGLQYLFPRADVLARADLSKAGIGKARTGMLRNLARATMQGQLTFSTSRTLEQAVAQVGAVCGIEESAAHYIAMRAFGEPDAFPSGEAELRRRLSGLKPVAPVAQAVDLVDAWRPWRAYAAMHLAQ